MPTKNHNGRCPTAGGARPQAWVARRLAFVVLPLCLGLTFWLPNIGGCQALNLPRDAAAAVVDDEVPKCPVQPPARAPSVVWQPETNSTWLDESAARLGAAVRIRTVSYDDMDLDPTREERFKPLVDFHAFLAETFPLFHSVANLTKVNTYGLLYEWTGSDPSLKPALYQGHQDVVPVPEDTVSRWSHEPFSGEYDRETGLVWGRGSSDDKNMLISIFEAFEQLQSEGFRPRRTILLSSGFDEEIGGQRGAGTLLVEMLRRYGNSGERGNGNSTTDKPLEFIIDEGGLGIGTTQQGRLDVALPAVGEKGYADMRIDIETEGGHSSIPPDHTAIGMLSEMLVDLEKNPFEPSLSTRNPVLTHLICLADALDEQELRGGGGADGDDQAETYEGFVLDRALRKQLRRPDQWPQAARRIAKDGTRTERFVIQTSQAIDVITGGVKANALPESASATINYRVSVDATVQQVVDKVEGLVARVARRHNLELSVDGPEKANSSDASEPARRDAPSEGKQASGGKVKLTVIQSTEPTPVSPVTSSQFGMLASTIRHVFPGRGQEGQNGADEKGKGNATGSDRIVTPGVMAGNTDLRRYSDLSTNIWRFHPNTFMMNSGKHTVDERMDIRAHAKTTRFIHALVRNTDGPI
ncbi:uncharacterized protein PSFLO_04395 [Pseudozyma flocculosa]|uniref:Peptidase M20 dimerisation domain-containing protein n=1 Tax=Pseudozyma flocculosa TaxID=84751 RepID=A0A5C3F4N3_9BASI|nr:uncharacterized protein PSFLO_04395 [Pseudozyma flocculosa]